jgi:hypothetical protein
MRSGAHSALSPGRRRDKNIIELMFFFQRYLGSIWVSQLSHEFMLFLKNLQKLGQRYDTGILCSVLRFDNF